MTRKQCALTCALEKPIWLLRSSGPQLNIRASQRELQTVRSETAAGRPGVGQTEAQSSQRAMSLEIADGVGYKG